MIRLSHTAATLNDNLPWHPTVPFHRFDPLAVPRLTESEAFAKCRRIEVQRGYRAASSHEGEELISALLRWRARNSFTFAELPAANSVRLQSQR